MMEKRQECNSESQRSERVLISLSFKITEPNINNVNKALYNGYARVHDYSAM